MKLEAALLKRPTIEDHAVTGLLDGAWGEATIEALVLKNGTLDLPELRDWCKDRISVYKIPQRLKVVSELPRNAMGKVTKPAVRALFA